MLHFLIFLGWLAVFCTPLFLSIIDIIRKKEVARKRWWFNGLWVLGGGSFILVGGWILRIWTEVLWFEELGYTARFWTVFWTKCQYFLLGAISFYIFFWLNIRFTRFNLSQDLKEGFSWLYLIGTGVSFCLALLFGLVTKSYWNEFLLYQHQVPFGMTDPIFNKDIGFYVFTLPILQFWCNWLMLVLFLTIIAVIVVYLIQRYLVREKRWDYKDEDYDALISRIRWRGITHISILGIILMLVFIFATRISIWNLLFSTRGVVFGAGWTDVHVQIGAYWFFIVTLVLASIFLVISAIAKSTKITEWMAASGFGICLLTWLIGVIIVPAIVQHVKVSPNELAKETEYIKHNIAFTREAYGLANIAKSDFPVNQEINSSILEKDKETLSSIRLWDWRVLRATNFQNQAFRLYYSFPDVDVVRYRINDKIIQLMYSSRELDQERLAEKSKTWVNKRLVYTHGFGGCANPVNTFTAEGLPDYWIKDIPPISKFPELQINQPRIYFGESTLNHVYVKTKQSEFDYPKGDQNVTFFYDGLAGIEIRSGLRKFAFALRFDGIRLLTSNELTPQSKILFRRDVRNRIYAMAPFLRYDNDVYQVVALGNLWFIWDAYTATDNYPYSEPHSESNLNYIRNSVKVVINAYTGKVDFYVFDERDPLIKAYQRIFPGFFKPASMMPSELHQHIRYPEDLLRIQGEIYSVYHMDNPTVFYNKEDAWEIAKESSVGTAQRVLPYYVVMRVPEEKKEEFILMLPFTPLTTDEKNPRNNMVSWLAGRCDGEHYGKLILYTFPKERLIYGPLQIGIRINQDEVISKDFTLWNQQGSQVITGNLLVIPLSEYRLLYVQPIYLQAQVGKMPELKRVVVASGEKLAYGTSFQDALTKLVGEYVAPQIIGREEALKPQDLIKEAVRHLELYRQLTGQGKFAEAGKEMEQLRWILNKLLK